MSRPRGFRQLTCQVCGTTWSDRGARFCGHCGAALLEQPAPERAADDREPDGRSKGWLVGVLAVGVVAALAAVIGIGGAPAWLEADPREEMSTDVELPEPEDVTDPDAAEAPAPDPGTLGLPSGDLSCEPDGCELWRLERPADSQVVMSSTLIHLEATRSRGGSSLGQGASDEDQPSVETVVAAYAIESGQPRWTHVLQERIDPDSVQLHSALVPVDEDLLLVASEGTTTYALDPQTGAMLWSASFDHQVREAARGGAGEVILWGPGAPNEVEEAVPEEDVQEGTPEAVPMPSSMRVTAVEAASGEVRWTERGDWIMGLDREHLLLLEEVQDRVTALDLTTGERLWEHEHNGQIVPGPVSIRSGRVVLTEGREVHVLDVRTGDSAGVLDLDFEPAAMATVVGDMLLVTDGARGSEPGRGELYDLFDLDAAPRRIDDLVGEVVLREGRPASHWAWLRSPAEGLLIATQDKEFARLEMLDPDGSSRWQASVPLAGPQCCVRLQAGRDASTVILVPPEDGEGLPQVISTETGTSVGGFVVPPGSDDRSLWFGGLAIYGLVGEGEREVVLAGPAGQVRVSGAGLPVSGSPIPILQGERGVIVIDPAMLFGDE